MSDSNSIQDNLHLLDKLGFKQDGTTNYKLEIDDENSIFVYGECWVYVANYDEQVFLSNIKTITQLEALVKLLRGEEILATNQNQIQ